MKCCQLVRFHQHGKYLASFQFTNLATHWSWAFQCWYVEMGPIRESSLRLRSRPADSKSANHIITEPAHYTVHQINGLHGLIDVDADAATRVATKQVPRDLNISFSYKVSHARRRRQICWIRIILLIIVQYLFNPSFRRFWRKLSISTFCLTCKNLLRDNLGFYQNRLPRMPFSSFSDWHNDISWHRSSIVEMWWLPCLIYRKSLGSTHIGKGYGDVPRSWPPFFRPVGSPANQFTVNAPLLCLLFSIFRKFLHFQPCFDQNSSSLDPFFSNFRSQDPHFSRKIHSLDPTFWNPRGTHPPKKKKVEAPPPT